MGDSGGEPGDDRSVELVAKSEMGERGERVGYWAFDF